MPYEAPHGCRCNAVLAACSGDRIRAVGLELKASFVVGFLAMFPVALVMVPVALVAIAQEVDNRSAARLRQQWNIDKSHMLKLDSIRKQNRTEECRLSDSEIRCLVYPGGEMKIAVSN